MKTIYSAVIAVMIAGAIPVVAGELSRAPTATPNPPAQTLPLRQPTNIELLQAISNLSDQVTQLQGQVNHLQGELTSVQGKQDAALTREIEDYQRLSWRVLEACKVAYLRSYKAGDNPSSGTGPGNPYLPDAWCDIGSYPYWKSIQ